MTDGVATELLCSVCDEVCKKGSQMKCCGVRACKACAMIKINKTKKCWNKECNREDIIVTDDDIFNVLKNDDLLRHAVDHFKKNGKMDPKHGKMLKKAKDATILEKKLEIEHNAHEKMLRKTRVAKFIKIMEKKKERDKEAEERNAGVDVAEKFKQRCSFGSKCTRKLCLFVHDKSPEKEATSKTSARLAGNGRTCTFGVFCRYKDVCENDHPKFESTPCRYGTRCTRMDCKFEHSPSSQGGRRPEGDRGDDFRSFHPHSGSSRRRSPSRVRCRSRSPCRMRSRSISPYTAYRMRSRRISPNRMKYRSRSPTRRIYRSRSPCRMRWYDEEVVYSEVTDA